MRFEKISFRNYRQIRHLEIVLKKYDHDIHIYIAQNGTAKTNVLNAINWCLYGNEPHLSSKSQNLPLINLNLLEEENLETKHNVVIELHIRSDNDDLFIFTRTKRFIIKKLDKSYRTPVDLGEEFTLAVSKANNVTLLFKNDEARQEVERFIPERLKDFYFFDGERLDTYFKDVTGGHLKEAISNIPGIDTIKTILKRINNISTDFSREISVNNPEALTTNAKLELVKGRIEENEGLKNSYINDEKGSKQRMTELEENLRGIPDITTFEGERKILDKKNDKIKEKIEWLRKEKGNTLYEIGKFIFLNQQIKEIDDLITEKRKNNELPPRIDRDLLTESVAIKECKICNHELPDKCYEAMNALLLKFDLSTKIAYELTEIQPVLRMIIEKIGGFKNVVKGITDQIDEQQLEYNLNFKRQKEIDNFFETHHVDNIKKWSEERLLLENAIDSNREKLGIVKKSISDDIVEKELLEKKLARELEKAKGQSKKQRMLKVMTKTQTVLTKLHDNLNDRIRKDVEIYTNKYFETLIWKKETYDKVIINKDFSLELNHKLGYPALGTISAAERELLALSFTLALHKISGFEGPIFIDTPVARVSDVNRVNMGEVLLEISAHKQIALLFTPDEFSDNIREVFSRTPIDKNRIVMVKNEREVKMEEF